MGIYPFRGWWAEDHRIAGRPLSILLYAISRESGEEITQSKARAELGIGERAWVSAKQKLAEAGFLVEVWDRYPKRDRRRRMDPDARPLQKRFRLFLRDAPPGTYYSQENTRFQLDVATEDLTPEEWPKGLLVPGSWQNQSSIYLDEPSWREFKGFGSAS